MDPRILEAIRPLTTCLEDMDVPYEISGSIASSIHGVPRSSIDADLLAALDAPRVGRLARILKDRYYLSEARMEDAVRRGASFNLIHLDTMLKVDVFVARSDRYENESLGRRVRHSLGEEPFRLEVFVASAEDIVLHKLRWFRKGGEVSNQQWLDVAGVLKVQAGRLDRAYMERWAKELQVADLLGKAFEEIG
jgi:hypothetical protein